MLTLIDKSACRSAFTYELQASSVSIGVTVVVAQRKMRLRMPTIPELARVTSAQARQNLIDCPSL